MPVKGILYLAYYTVFGLALLQLNAFGWDGAGHMVIAAEAIRQMSPALKAQANEVLKAHPDYDKWVRAYHSNSNFDLAAYVFMRSSTWPDEIRRSGSRYDHPDWHFIDYPLRPPAFAFEADAKPSDDVLYGVAECEKTLSDTNADPELRAAQLSFLIHLIGDMHQPLHCESFFGPGYPKGDRGGNDFYVKIGERGIRLHGIWDGMLGTSENPRVQWGYGAKIEDEFPRDTLQELKEHSTAKEWSLESRALAIEKGYLNGNLQGGRDLDSAVPLPAGYTKDAKAVAERQAALAGYRLADDIKTYLKTSGSVPLLDTNAVVAAQVMPQRIGTGDASKYYDESMIVTGKVVEVSQRSRVAFLDLDRPYPASTFTAVIFEESRGRFGELQQYQGQSVEISGTITKYRNKPEVVLESPDQIKVVGAQ